MVPKFKKQYLYILSLTFMQKNPLSGNITLRLKRYKALLFKFRQPFMQRVYCVGFPFNFCKCSVTVIRETITST